MRNIRLYGQFLRMAVFGKVQYKADFLVGIVSVLILNAVNLFLIAHAFCCRIRIESTRKCWSESTIRTRFKRQFAKNSTTPQKARRPVRLDWCYLVGSEDELLIL